MIYFNNYDSDTKLVEHVIYESERSNKNLDNNKTIRKAITVDLYFAESKSPSFEIAAFLRQR